MYKDKTITVVIPCHNEEMGLKATYQMLPKFIDHIVVVDNFSTDRTFAVAGEIGAIAVKENEKKGYGYAYQKGFSSLPTNTDIVVTCDGDGTYPMDELTKILDFIIDENFDFISCSRFPLKDKQAMRLANKIGNWGLTFWFLILTGHYLADSQSGMWVFKKDVLIKLHPYSGGMPFSEEIKMEAILNSQIKFREFHIGYKDRVGQTTLNKLKDGWDNLIFLFKKRYEIRHRVK